MEQLSAKKIAVLVRLAAGDSAQSAAKAVGVSKSSVDKWKIEPGFKKELQEACSKIFDMAIAEVCSGAVEAAKELKQLIIDPSTPKRVKVSAIQVLLTTAARAKDAVLEERLDRLESSLDNDVDEIENSKT